jgi:hypothetical protein
MKKIFTLILLLFLVNNLQGQTIKRDSIKKYFKNYELKFSAGLAVQNQWTITGDIGLIYGENNQNIHVAGNGYKGIKVGSEFNFSTNDFILGPKICYERTFLLVGGRLSLIDYTNFKTNDFRLTPEIGLSLLGLINIFYGWNFPLSDNRIPQIGIQRVSLTINFLGWH